MSRIHRIGVGMVMIVTLVALAGCAETRGRPQQVYWNRALLVDNSFAPLPLGSIKPRGWLQKQLRIQADGLSGHLDEFWPDLGPNSGWLGGTGESWERGPYFLDGLLPLAYLLEDQKLITKAKKWVEWTLTSQMADGMIGPDPRRGKYAQEWQSADWWPNMVMLKVLTQYQEVSGDPRVIPLMQKYFRYHLKQAKQRPLIRWARHRWAEEILSIVWLYNRTGDKDLLDLARELKGQSFDWKAHFAGFKYTGKVDRKDANLDTHVVNNAMAMKTSAVWWQISGEESDRMAIYQLLDQMDRYHLLPNGVHSGDEHYAGKDPSQGTELCAVVEGMFSLEQLIAILGDPAFADRLERMTFNALPATFKADMWAHQYDQQPNQIKCSIDKNRNWTTNGPDSNLFGLEPNFGCCTSNMHQGWPKFVSHLWMATRDGGLAAIAYAPSRVEADVRGGARVSIEAETEYPFRDKIRLTLHSAQPAVFPLRLRVPGWAAGARISILGKEESGVKAGDFHKIEREWRDGDTVNLTFPMPVVAERHFEDSLVLRRGPMVFALQIGEHWQKVKGEEPHADWEVHPTTPWNYGLLIDARNPSASITLEEPPAGDIPFSGDSPALRLKVKARKVPQWKMVNSSAGPLPKSPVRSNEAEETVILIPYGSAKLRVTAFPEIGVR